MRIVIPCLIIFFMILIIYQIFLAKHTTIEGLANSTAGQSQSYDSNDISTLAHKNAGNIQVLQEQVKGLQDLQTDVKTNTSNITKMTTQISSLQQQVTSLSQQQTDAANQVNKKLPVTGTS